MNLATPPPPPSPAGGQEDPGTAGNPGCLQCLPHLPHTRVLSLYIMADPISLNSANFLARAFAFRLNSTLPTKVGSRQQGDPGLSSRRERAGSLAGAYPKAGGGGPPQSNRRAKPTEQGCPSGPEESYRCSRPTLCLQPKFFTGSKLTGRKAGSPAGGCYCSSPT